MRQVVADVAAGPVRNLCPNPRGVATNPPSLVPTGYSGPGLTTALAPWGEVAAKAVASGSSTPYLFSPVAAPAFKAGDTVTVTARVAFENAPSGAHYHFGIHQRSPNTYISPGLAASTLIPVLTGGAWETRTRTFTLTADVPAGQLDVAVVFYSTSTQGMAPAGMAAFMGRVTITTGPTVPVYGDGDTPDWRWTGTVNASESVGWPVPPRLGVAPTPEVVNLVPNPRMVGTAWWTVVGARTPTADSDGLITVVASGGATTRAAVIVNNAPNYWPAGTYTVAVEARLGSTKFTSMRCLLYNASTAQTLSVTFPTPPRDVLGRVTITGTTTFQFDRVYLDFQGADVVDGDVAGYLRQPMVTPGSVAHRYVDGTQPGCVWLGTANASQSVRPSVSPLVRNLALNPAAAGTLGWLSNNSSVWTATRDTSFVRRPGGTSSRQTNLADNNTVGSWYAVGHLAYTTTSRGFRATPGKVYNLSAYFASNATGAQVRIWVTWFDAAGTQIGSPTYMTRETLAAVDQWQRFALVTPPAPTGATQGSFACDLWRGTSLIPAGSYGWVADAQVTEGVTLWPYIDGDRPGAKWIGTAHASESVGYDDLWEIAGSAALAMVTTPGTSSPALPLSTTEGRTIYVVHDVFNDDSNLPVYLTLGPTSGNGRLLIRGDNTDLTGFSNTFRWFTGASGGVSVFRYGVRTPGRHVSIGWSTDGATSVGYEVDSAGSATMTPPVGTGDPYVANPVLTLGAATSSDAPVVGLAFRGAHDSDTRKRVMAWLGRQYGSPVPAGY